MLLLQVLHAIATSPSPEPLSTTTTSPASETEQALDSEPALVASSDHKTPKAMTILPGTSNADLADSAEVCQWTVLDVFISIYSMANSWAESRRTGMEKRASDVAARIVLSSAIQTI